jgi:hypothetical protein
MHHPPPTRDTEMDTWGKRRLECLGCDVRFGIDAVAGGSRGRLRQESDDIEAPRTAPAADGRP